MTAPERGAVDEAYAEVLGITRREAKNFAYGIMVLPRDKRRAIAAIYAYARAFDDIADGDLPADEKRTLLEAMRASLERDPVSAIEIALHDARARYGIPHEALSALIDGGLQDLEQTHYATFEELRGYCDKVAGAVGVACVAVYGSDDVERAMTLGIALQLINIMRDVAEDIELGRVHLPQDELDRFGVTVLSFTPQFQELMAFQAQRARAHLEEGLRLLDSLDRRSALCVSTFAGLYRGQLDRMEADGFDVFDTSCRLSTREKLAVVARGYSRESGNRRGGLAGLTAAIELMDAGVDVELYEARPTLGGAVQTLPARESDPDPPPDNGQHIALGCFTEYLRFLDRVGQSGSYLRTRLALPVIDEQRRVSSIRPSPAGLLAYKHLSTNDRLRIPVTTVRLRNAKAEPGETFGHLLRRHGATDESVAKFWDVFIRPALNLPTDEVDAAAGLFTVRTALLGPRGNADLVLPTAPLGHMHGDAAGRVLGARVHLDAKVESLDDLDADAVVVATPPVESARLLGEEPPGLEDSPIVSVHLWFSTHLLRSPLAALLGSDAHWVFDGGALTGHLPERGQYLTVVSSGVPELLAIRGRELVDRIAGQLTKRLGDADLLWSRVSREPYATIALRPGVVRPGVATGRDNIARAGAWTDTGWPATMESAVRSGRRAAQFILSHARSTTRA